MADAIKVRDRDGNITFLSPEYLEKFPDEGFSPVEDDPYAGLTVSGPLPQTIVDGPAPEQPAEPDVEKTPEPAKQPAPGPVTPSTPAPETASKAVVSVKKEDS